MFQPRLPLTLNGANAALTEGLQVIETGEYSIDLTTVTAVDSAAVAILLAWQRAARVRGATLVFYHSPPALCSLAELYGVSELLNLPTHRH